MDAKESENSDVITHSALGLSENEAATCSSSNQNVEIGKASPKLDINTDIDSLYEDAVEGKIESFKEYKKPLDQLVTPNKNTVLHIYITALRPKTKLETGPRFVISKFIKTLWSILLKIWRLNSPETPCYRCTFVEEILKMCPGMLWQVNNKDETLLHIASRHGHVDIVEFLLQKCKNPQNDQEKGVEAAREMLRMTNTAKDTAMHEAVRYDHLDVVRKLIVEYPDCADEANVAGESPLYLAAERGYRYIVATILLSLSSSLPYGSGPKGRTALHAAALRNDFGMTSVILLANGDLRTIKDEQGWIPLHYAADYGYIDIVRLLLCIDKSEAYCFTDEGKKTALHIAASRGNVKIMEELISSCPGCSELVDERGWNVLHFAVESRNSKAVELILENPSLSNLINEYNDDGNTPLHQLAALGLCMNSFIGHPKVDKLAFNKQNYNALDITFAKDDALSRAEKYLQHCLRNNGIRDGGRVEVNKDERNSKGNKNKDGEVIANSKEAREAHPVDGPSSYNEKGKNKDGGIIANIKEAREAHLVVATLIATVTFAAGFTVPGGFKGEGSPDQGTAILTRSAAFKAFVITNTIAMMLSSSAVFLHLFLALNRDKVTIISQFMHELKMIIFAMYAMVVAFITGTYAVLAPSMGLAIATCVIGCIFFPLYGYLLSESILDLIDILKAKIKILQPHSSKALDDQQGVPSKMLNILNTNNDPQFSMDKQEIAKIGHFIIVSMDLIDKKRNLVGLG